ADADHAKVNLNLPRVRGGHQPTKAASANGGFIDSGIDATLIHATSEHCKDLPDCAEATHKSIPEIAIQPVGQTRSHPTERDDRVSIKFVDPHFIGEKATQCGLRIFEWVDLSRATSSFHPSLAIHPKSDADARTHQDEGKKEHRLNQTTD